MLYEVQVRQIGPVAESAFISVDYFIEYLDTVIRLAYLVQVRIYETCPERRFLPVFSEGVPFFTEIAARFSEIPVIDNIELPSIHLFPADGREDSQHCKRDCHGTSGPGKKRQGDAYNRQKTQIHPDIDKKMHKEIKGDTAGHETPERRFGPERYTDALEHDENIKHKHPESSPETKLLTHRREYEISQRRGQKTEFHLSPFAEAFASEPA